MRKIGGGGLNHNYPETRTWSPFQGCRFDCIYCEYSWKRQARRQKHNCMRCYNYEPHKHPERLNRIPSAPVVFVGGSGDVSFIETDFCFKIIEAIKEHNPRMEKEFYWQSKKPDTFDRFKDKLPDNCILLTTLETNRDKEYRDISKAPLPSERFKQFKELDYPRKVVTVEPVMDFDLNEFSSWLGSLDLEYLWFGFDSHPQKVEYPEPTEEKAQRMVSILKNRYGTEVRGKSLRGVEIR